MKKVFWLALCFLALAQPAFAVTTITRNVSEVDWMMSACLEIVSSTPSVTIATSLCGTVNDLCADGESAFFTRCTIDTTTPCCFFVGPATNLKATITSAGIAKVWFGGRVAP